MNAGYGEYGLIKVRTGIKNTHSTNLKSSNEGAEIRTISLKDFTIFETQTLFNATRNYTTAFKINKKYCHVMIEKMYFPPTRINIFMRRNKCYVQI